MDVFRIAKKSYIADLTGEGARRYGGRWNRKGTSVLYAAESRSLAIVEYLVHLPIALAAADLCIARIHVPDDGGTEKLDIRKLPADWRAYPAPGVLADLGTAWAGKGVTLVLRVPSAVVTGEYNLLLNPGHRLFSKVKIREIESFEAMKRLYGNKGTSKYFEFKE